MRVILINGSPHKNGNTHDMLMDLMQEFEKIGVETKEYWIGTGCIHGCIACGRCDETHRCIFNDDLVNKVIEDMQTADGLVVGSPVYYASPNGSLISALDRIFYASKNSLHHKPGAACVVARRAGTTSSLEVLEKYFTITEMPVVSSVYWPMEHGRGMGETREDKEGIYIMKRLAKNMAWLMKCIKLGEEHGIEPDPIDTDRPWTHFIR